MVGNNLTEKQLQEIVDKTILYSDKDGDGKISYEEFCDVSYSVNTFYTCTCRSLSLPVNQCRCLYGSLIKFKGEMWFIEMFLVHLLLFCDAVYMRRYYIFGWCLVYYIKFLALLTVAFVSSAGCGHDGCPV